MKIQNNLLFLFICITYFNADAMEQSFITNQNSFSTPQERNIWLAYINTEEYKDFNKAEAIYKKNSTPETLARRKEAATKLLMLDETQQFTRMAMEKSAAYKQYQNAKLWYDREKTTEVASVLKCCETELHNSKEYKNWLHTQQISPAQPIKIVHNHSTQTFSNNVLKKYQAVQNTFLYQEYNTAKKFPGMYESDAYDDHNTIRSCLKMLCQTKEFIELLESIHQEENAMNNLIQSEKWVAEQKYIAFPWIESMSPGHATQEARHLQTKLIDFLFNKLETQLLLDAIYLTTITHPRTNRAMSNCFIEPKGTIIYIPLKSPKNNNNSCVKKICTTYSFK